MCIVLDNQVRMCTILIVQEMGFKCDCYII